MICWLPQSDTGQTRSGWTCWQLRRTKRPRCLLAAVVYSNSQIRDWKESLEVKWAPFAALAWLASDETMLSLFFPPAHFGIRPYELYGEGAVDPDTSHARIQAVCGSRVSFCTCGRVGAGTSDGWGNVCPGVPTQREILKRNCVKFWWILWISIVQFPCGSIFLSCDDSCCVLGRFVHCRGV